MVRIAEAVAMTWWSWSLTILVWLILAWQLWRAGTRGEITGRMCTYSRWNAPVAFWISVIVYSALFLLINFVFAVSLARLVAGLPPLRAS